jgi:hypothetical protein
VETTTKDSWNGSETILTLRIDKGAKRDNDALSQGERSETAKSEWVRIITVQECIRKGQMCVKPLGLD